MSWFKLNVNDSLNTIKGQISNVSNVVHDVFTEGIIEDTKEDIATKGKDDEESLLTALESANSKIDELSSLCQGKDDEVSMIKCKCVKTLFDTHITFFRVLVPMEKKFKFFS